MTAIRISLEKGVEGAKKYALGVSLAAIPQVVIAVILTKYIAENPTILETLEKVGIIIFIGLSYYFYNESKKGKIKTESIKSKKENPFLTGITLSFLNMFAIPFFCGIIVALDLFELFSFEVFPIFFFILGTILGTFCILFDNPKRTENSAKNRKINKRHQYYFKCFNRFSCCYNIYKTIYLKKNAHYKRYNY